MATWQYRDFAEVMGKAGDADTLRPAVLVIVGPEKARIARVSKTWLAAKRYAGVLGSKGCGYQSALVRFIPPEANRGDVIPVL